MRTPYENIAKSPVVRSDDIIECSNIQTDDHQVVPHLPVLIVTSAIDQSGESIENINQSEQSINNIDQSELT